MALDGNWCTAVLLLSDLSSMEGERTHSLLALAGTTEPGGRAMNGADLTVNEAKDKSLCSRWVEQT